MTKEVASWRNITYHSSVHITWQKPRFYKRHDVNLFSITKSFKMVAFSKQNLAALQGLNSGTKGARGTVGRCVIVG